MSASTLWARALPASTLLLLCTVPGFSQVSNFVEPAEQEVSAPAAEPLAEIDLTPDLTPDFPLATPVEAVSGQFAPMTVKEKTDYYLKATFSPQAIGRLALTNGFRQVNGSDFGGGLGGFSKSFGSRYAEHVTKRTVQFGIGALRGEDPRFHRSNKEGFWGRTGFVLSRTVLVDMDNGGTSIAVGKLAGTFASNTLSQYWQPGRPNVLKQGLTDTGLSLASDVAMRMVREFWPDIKRAFKR